MNVDPTIRTPDESAARKFYQAYLNSGSWRTTRNRALQRAGYRCERCNTKRDLQVHHRSYERLGREWDQDLEVLCEDCHGDHHEIEKARQGVNPRIYLKLVAGVMHGRSVQTFSDVAEAAKTECARLKIPYDSEKIGHALELISGKQRTKTPAVAAPALMTSTEPLNKADAMRIFAELTKGESVPALKSMPSIGTSPNERHSHRTRILEQVRDVQREAYQREAKRESIEERLNRIFSEPPA